MAGICNIADTENGKNTFQGFHMTADLLPAIYKLLQEVTDIQFHLGLTIGLPCTKKSSSSCVTTPSAIVYGNKKL